MDKIEILKRYPFYTNTSAAFRRELEEAAVTAQLSQGQYYFHEGDACTQVALVGKGSIRVYKSGESGREITLYHVRSGETCILTASCVLAGMAYPAHGLVESDIEAAVFPAPRFRQWVAKREEVRQFVFETLAARMAEVMALVEEITFNKLDRRLVSYLLKRFANEGRPLKFLHLTHEQIAVELGSAREVISRILKDLERLGALELSRCRIGLKDEQKLRRMCGFS
ncbi:MAG: Crp/Fnr family transcriptional regulator [Calditrichaeota bacterium]|nr:MAG: Crp/Fnr family transcriptional regulator [Calditrichota bacterium]